jgi:inhibitor of KinA sporulation pathway (predicted exonuclease)
MRERAQHHPHQTAGMREAIAVFDEWLSSYQEPNEEERKAQVDEWEQHYKLCSSLANAHSYVGDDKEAMKRARAHAKAGAACLLRSATSAKPITFPLAAFTAVFGGPGLHGYGTHILSNCSGVSHVVIESHDEFQAIVGKCKHLAAQPERVIIRYDRVSEIANVELVQPANHRTLDSMLQRKPLNKPPNKETAPGMKEVEAAVVDVPLPAERTSSDATAVSVWVCAVCTLQHHGEGMRHFLVCSMCGAERKSKKIAARASALMPAAASPQPVPPPQPAVLHHHNQLPHKKVTTTAASWGGLQPPSHRDIVGPRKRRRALDAPPLVMDHLLVLDFEWTADNTKKMLPLPEITQFPTVAMRLVQNRRGEHSSSSSSSSSSPSPSPSSPLSSPSLSSSLRPISWVHRDMEVFASFDTFVRPTLNPTLSRFAVELTAITQQQVDAAPKIEQVLPQYMRWLEQLGLVDEDGNRTGHWAIVTWGDGDVMTVLRQELEYKGLQLPACFDHWVNLKDDSCFKKHFGREPRGGLRSCVESVGAEWTGRAHNGMVDSINTAKIVRKMVQTGFKFTRATRGIGRDGQPFGAKLATARQVGSNTEGNAFGSKGKASSENSTSGAF